MSEENKTEGAKKAREPKKNSIPMAEVTALVEGIPQYTKASFLVVGHKDGVRIAIPKTAGVARALFYAKGDYTLVPEDPAITVFTEEQRKEKRLGGIMAEVNFEAGVDAARAALTKLVAVVRAAETPTPKVVKPKAPKKEKAVAPAKASASVDGTGSVTPADDNEDGETAEA